MADAAWRTDGATSELLRALHDGGRSRFFVHPADRRALVAALQAREPEAVTATARAADEVCSHRVPLLGRGAVYLGDPIDWHRDPVSGLHWEIRHHSTIDYLDLARSSDLRLVWELSRSHQWVTLGHAHWLTGDPRYGAAFELPCERLMAGS